MNRKLLISFSGLIIAGGFVASVASTLAPLGKYFWFFDLFSHFTVQYFLGLLAVSTILSIMKFWKSALTFFLFSLMNLIFILPLYLGKETQLSANNHSFRLLLLNVHTQNDKHNLVKDLIISENPDIIVLQEINRQWLKQLSYLGSSHSHQLVETREDNFGIGVFSKFPLADGKIEYIKPAEVPTTICTVKSPEADFRLIATHPLPPINFEYASLRDEQLAKLPFYTKTPQATLLVGDLNTTPWSFHFKQLIKKSKLIDSSVGYGVQPTWSNGNPMFLISLDHCLHSDNIIITNRKIGKNVGSDHFPVIVDFSLLN